MIQVESEVLFERLNEKEAALVNEVVRQVLEIVAKGPWHGHIAVVGGQLNKEGQRKDIDIRVFCDDEIETGGFAITYAIEDALTSPDRTLAFKKLWNALNGKTAFYLQDPDNLTGTPIHLILPTHRIGGKSLQSPWPWDKNKKYTILATF